MMNNKLAQTPLQSLIVALLVVAGVVFLIFGLVSDMASNYGVAFDPENISGNNYSQLNKFAETNETLSRIAEPFQEEQDPGIVGTISNIVEGLIVTGYESLRLFFELPVTIGAIFQLIGASLGIPPFIVAIASVFIVLIIVIVIIRLVMKVSP